jgi:hypothetical protein
LFFQHKNERPESALKAFSESSGKTILRPSLFNNVEGRLRYCRADNLAKNSLSPFVPLAVFCFSFLLPKMRVVGMGETSQRLFARPETDFKLV